MDFQQIFTTIAIICVGILAVFGLTTYWNTSYGTNVTAGFNQTTQHVQSMTQSMTGNLSTQSANNTYTQSGAGTGTTTTDLINRGLGVVTLLPQMLGIIPSMLQDGALILGIPPEYTALATAVFLFGFALLFAYLLIIGVKRLL
jgi:hypothetical protein